MAAEATPESTAAEATPEERAAEATLEETAAEATPEETAAEATPEETAAEATLSQKGSEVLKSMMQPETENKESVSEILTAGTVEVLKTEGETSVTMTDEPGGETLVPMTDESAGETSVPMTDEPASNFEITSENIAEAASIASEALDAETDKETKTIESLSEISSEAAETAIFIGEKEKETKEMESIKSESDGIDESSISIATPYQELNKSEKQDTESDVKSSVAPTELEVSDTAHTEVAKKTDTLNYETDDYTYLQLGTSSASVVKASLLPETFEQKSYSEEMEIQEDNIIAEVLDKDSVKKKEQNLMEIKRPDQENSYEIPYEVPSALKKYIDPSCTEWQDPKTRKMVYKLAVQNYYSDTGTRFERSDACLLNPTKKQLKSTYSRRDSLKARSVPGDLLKHMLKQKAAAELKTPHFSLSLNENWEQNRSEIDYLERKSVSDTVGLSSGVHNDKDLLDKRSHNEKEIAEYSHRTPGYGAFSFSSLSKLIIPEEDEDEANIVLTRQRKSDVDFRRHHKMTPSKLALESSLRRQCKSLSDVKQGKGERVVIEKEEKMIEKGQLSSKENQESQSYTSPPSLLKKTEQKQHLKGIDKSVGYGEISFTAPSKLLLMSENQEKWPDSKQPERILSASSLEKRPVRDKNRRRSLGEIQKEGYGEVDFNSPVLVLESLRIHSDTEVEASEASSDSGMHSENKSLDLEKKGSSAEVMNKSVTQDSESHGTSSEETQNQEEEKIDTNIDMANTKKLPAVNTEIEAIKTMLQQKLDEQSTLLEKQSLLSAVILQSLKKGNLLEGDLQTLISLHSAGIIDLEKSTPKNILRIQQMQGDDNGKLQNKKVPSGKMSLSRPQGQRHVDPSLPSEVLKRKIEKEIREKVTSGTIRRHSRNDSIDKGYESGVDTSVHTENDITAHFTGKKELMKKSKENIYQHKSDSRRFCFTSATGREETEDVDDVIDVLNPSSVFSQSYTSGTSMEELDMLAPASSGYTSYTDTRHDNSRSSGGSSSLLDDYEEELISFYDQEDYASKNLQSLSNQDDRIYEMGSNIQLYNFSPQPSKERLTVPNVGFGPSNGLKSEFSAKEINAEPGAEIYGLRYPNSILSKDVRFKDSPLYLDNLGSYISDSRECASSVASFPHIDSIQITHNPSFQALSDDGNDVQEESEELLHLPPRRVTSILDFLKLLYSRNPEFVRQSLSSADCEYKTLRQLLYTFSSTSGDDYFTGDFLQSPRKRSLPSVSPRSMTPEARSWLMEKEVLETQTRKLQMEVSTLHTENKVLKERLNRAQATVDSLESELVNYREEVKNVRITLQQQQTEADRKAKLEMSEEYVHLQSQIEGLYQENMELKGEVAKFEKHLEAAEKASNQVQLSAEKTKTLQAYKMEVLTLKEEVGRVKALLEQSENHLHEEEVRSKELSQQMLRLTEMKNLLQQQIDKGGGGTVSDKQIKSLEKRLKITEERLHQERADRANNLSEVEDKLLTENARLQAVEKGLNRQLQREKDKNRNLENKVKDSREEVEKLRLALPFDESTLTSAKSEEYDIPYSLHSNQRYENKKTPDYKYVMGQVEQQSGLTIGQEKEVICHLWSTRETTYQQFRHLQFILQDLKLPDNDLTAGLKQLRDLKSHYETRLQQVEEDLRDSQTQLATFETTYKEQLNTLVKERHDSFARLKTTEDLLEALRGENEILKANVAGSVGSHNSNGRDSQIDALNIEITNLENKIHHLQTNNQVLEGELKTLRVQLEAKEKALEDVQTEADLAHSRLNNTDAIERRQQKIEKLTSENQNLQADIRILKEKNNFLSDEKKRSDTDLANCQKELNVLKTSQKEGKAGDLADNKFVQSLQEELQQKDVQLKRSSHELQTLESELQHTRHAMYSEQASMANLQAQVQSLKDQLEQKTLMLDTLGGTESDSQSHSSSLKEMLESMSKEVTLLQTQNKTLQAEVNREKSRCEVLQEEMTRTSSQSGSSERSGLELQIKQLEEERDKLQEQLLEAAKASEELTQNVIDAQSEAQRLQQELSSEQAKLLHMSAQKGELEQHLEEIAEEHDALIQEKTQNEEDVVKLENKLQEIVQTFEVDAQRQHNNFQTHYSDIPPELRKMAGELDSVRTLLDAKNGELDMLQDKLFRQNMEAEFLQRRVELLSGENQCNREDIARLTRELANKIKEASSLREMNQLLARERSKIQRQRETEEREKIWEKTHNEKYRKEVSDVIHKLEEEKKFSSRNDKEELKSTNQRLDLLSSENEKVLNSLNVEKQATAQLKADLQKYQRECEELKEQLHVVTLELETAKAQLSARDETIESMKQDKGAFYQEYDSMCRRLAEKDEKIQNLQLKCDKTVESLREELSQQKLNLEQERTSTESDLDKAKESINNLNEEIKQKDAQLVTFGRALHELEELTKQKHELEHQVEKLTFDCSSVKQLLQNHQREMESQQSTINRMQEIQAKLQVEKTRLTDQLKEENVSSTRQIQELEKSISDLRSHHEGEKAYLKENLLQAQSKMQAMENSLASAVESRDKLQMTNRMLEHSLEETKAKLQEETTCYRVADKKSESLQTQLNDSRRERFLTEDKLNQCQTSLVKLEKELRTEKDRGLELEERIQELEAVSATQQSSLKAKQEQVEVLQTEIGKLRQIIDGQKQQLGGKLKKSTQEFKQQLDLMEMEKEQLSKQNQQLTFDLEKARETIQSKNKENLKLQEDILNLEDQIRERSSKLRKVEDNLKVEEEIQSKLASRYQEQEDEVKRLKNFLTKKAEEATDADKSMWQDMSKVIQDMSLKMQQHFEGAKERENQREQDLKLIKKYKKQVRDLETDLSTERAVHTITKSSLQALEEDCRRLRKQFMSSRRRDQSSAEKPSKSRMEAINEIIARSQTQAQNMLAAGGYFEETLRSITTPRGGNYNYHNNDGSPDTSIASDFSFNSVSPAVMAAYPSQAKSPRK
ncbi:uncharacterized protein LOC133181501 [Saccostrea echinata]|uniref:uncharacterized protein LOC133181501 n=1 Tax=Saccostrea echinata TaxID=191078 RepID=UPI002A83DA7F|nr:uncharacterized protein LOC133181501 [Saccostrea echinata]